MEVKSTMIELNRRLHLAAHTAEQLRARAVVAVQVSQLQKLLRHELSNLQLHIQKARADSYATA